MFYTQIAVMKKNMLLLLPNDHEPQDAYIFVLASFTGLENWTLITKKLFSSGISI